MAVRITEKAKQELIRMGVGGKAFLRISVVPGGCSGHTYNAAIEDEMGPGDQVVLEEGAFRAVADAQSLSYLDGLDIDYSEDLIQSGFRFKNTNAVKACGCGASFQL